MMYHLHIVYITKQKYTVLEKSMAIDYYKMQQNLYSCAYEKICGKENIAHLLNKKCGACAVGRGYLIMCMVLYNTL